MDEQAVTVRSAAVFLDKQKVFQDATVVVTDDAVMIYSKRGLPVAAYELIETAKTGMAWDVRLNPDGPLQRLVAQTGCGCGGQKSYQVDPDYSGTIGHQ
jgi:hypothetical protein